MCLCSQRELLEVGKPVYPDCVISSELKAYLEKADGLETLIAVVDSFGVLAQTHPRDMPPQFDVRFGLKIRGKKARP
jgi:hypothetical protein